jgi:glyoxylase-like metal-dependent hydrolase (beta-lactamase superfamily II)
VVHTPGHSPGSICLSLVTDGRTVLFCGDTIQFCPVAGHVGWISLLNAPGTSLDAYRASVRRLADLSVDVLLPGHRLFAMSDGQRVIRSVADGFATLSIPRSVI